MIIKTLLLVYLILKPFYLFASGGLQIADIFLIGAFVSLLISLKVNKPRRQELVQIIKENNLFVLFVGLTFFINGLYFLYDGEFKFVLSTLYFVFNLIAIITFLSTAKDWVFLKRVSTVFKFNLILQLVLYLVGIGRYYTDDRYMGTFNDPNQFGYFVLISFMFIYVLRIILGRRDRIIPYFVLALFLIILSASTGMLLGFAFFVIVLGLYYLWKYFPLSYSKIRKLLYMFSAGLAATVIVFVFIAFLPSTSKTQDSESQLPYGSLIERVEEKISKAEGEANLTLWEDRGYDIIFHYPLYVLYGAGEGAFDRFVLAANNHNNEIHGTFPSLLFYYGIIPFAILARWLYLKVRHVDPRILVAYSALFVESFTLLNQRQSLFWMIIVLGSVVVLRKTNEVRHA